MIHRVVIHASSENLSTTISRTIIRLFIQKSDALLAPSPLCANEIQHADEYPGLRSSHLPSYAVHVLSAPPARPLMDPLIQPTIHSPLSMSTSTIAANLLVLTLQYRGPASFVH
ncbi:hypothetical protein XPA_009304 [Xanthoria parietina]